MKKIDKNESAVVVIGSGAGGGTMVHELTKAGIPVVCLEAGPFLKKEDYTNDEWGAFMQMAWLDTRTTSGSWRVAKDFPGLPTWLVKAVGGTTTHWAGATPRFIDYEFKTLSTYGKIEGASLLDWPITLKDLEPYYDMAEKKIGSTHRHGRPPLPANNNYKVFANGAEKVGYKFYATGPYGTNATPYDGRPGSIQDGFNFQGDKNGSKWNTAVSEIPKALGTGLLDLRPNSHAIKITHDKSGKKVWASFDDFLDEESDILAQTAISTVMLFNAKIAANYQMDFAENKWRLARGLINEKGEVIEVDEDGNEKVVSDTSDADAGVIKDEENPPKEKKTVKAKVKKKGGASKKQPLTATK